MQTYEERIQEWQKTIEELKSLKYQGIMPSPPDPRDYGIESIPVSVVRSLPEKHINPKPPIIQDQGQTSFCAGATGAGIAKAVFSQYGKMPSKGFSMNFLYWLAKEYDGIPDTEGTFPRTVLKVMQKYGCAPEISLPYSVGRVEIPTTALRSAEDYKISVYARLATIQQIKQALADGNYVFVATMVTSDNWKAQKGYLSMPKGDLYGGHATFFYGYDDTLKYGNHDGYFHGINSWGSGWGDKGSFYMPYDYYHSARIGSIKAFLEAWVVKFPELGERSPQQQTPEFDVVGLLELIRKMLEERKRR